MGTVSKTNSWYNLFLTEEARLTYKKFPKYKISGFDRVNISNLVRLEAIITDIVQKFQHTVVGTK